jgi:prolyl oligopeptidase
MASPKPKPPKARRIDCFTQLGDRLINDPYRWMEDDSPDLQAWVREQHEHTIAQLSSLPVRDAIRKRLEVLMTTAAKGPITKAGSRYFFRRRLADQELPALYCRDTPNDAARLLIDPTKLSSDSSITIADIHPSPDGSLLAYRLCKSGSSNMSLHVMDVDSSEQLPDVIPGDVNPVAHVWHTKNRVAWVPDSSGFYYTRCPQNTPVAESRFHHKLYFHQVGKDWRDDELVFGEAIEREQSPFPVVSADGRYVAVLVQDLSGVAPRSELQVLDRRDPQRAFFPIVRDVEAFINAAVFHRDRLYIQTNDEAPQGKVVAFKLADFSTATVIPAGAYALRSWTTVADYLFVETIEDVSSRLRVFDLEGNFVKQIELPYLGSISGFNAEPESDGLLFSFSSFVRPRAVYRVDLRTLTCRLHQKDEVAFDPELFVIEQVWLESLDKTPIPMFLVHRRDIQREGENAVVIHAYGGFGVSLLPAFSAHVMPFLERGGVYAIVNARGGGEFGEAWHQAGTREKKQNTFDDLIAAGEWLIANGYTSAEKLGCFGWSNGGLTVNTVAVQRPDLWKAIVAGSAVTDMARFHLVNSGEFWIADYGSPMDQNDLNYLMQYSPYHTVPVEIDAPAFLTIVPGNDDRVAPWHSYKMHAAWLHSNISQRPILLRGEEQAGHHGSPAASRAIDLYADIWGFFAWQLGME